MYPDDMLADMLAGFCLDVVRRTFRLSTDIIPMIQVFK
jgi:hypothetical protein